jgi:hypothetical protein
MRDFAAGFNSFRQEQNSMDGMTPAVISAVQYDGGAAA